MKANRQTGVAVCVAIVLCTAVVPGKDAFGEDGRNRRFVLPVPYVLVQNEPADSDAVHEPVKKPNATSSDGAGQASGQKGQRDKEAKQPKAKPLVPFVPSEKIAAEQAVDFPVDI